MACRVARVTATRARSEADEARLVERRHLAGGGESLGGGPSINRRPRRPASHPSPRALLECRSSISMRRLRYALFGPVVKHLASIAEGGS